MRKMMAMIEPLGLPDTSINVEEFLDEDAMRVWNAYLKDTAPTRRTAKWVYSTAQSDVRIALTYLAMARRRIIELETELQNARWDAEDRL